MKKTTTRLAVLTLLSLGIGASPSFATRAVPPPDDTVMCGGNLGWWAGEPFWDIDGTWSVGITANCSDRSVEYVVIPVDMESVEFEKP